MIKRDGQRISLWQDNAEPYTSVAAVLTFPYDVIIVGGGITGLSTGLLLQEAGKKCLLLEANTLCFGTTGGTTAHLNTLLDTPYSTIAKNFGKEDAVMVADAVKEAIHLIKTNIQRFQIDCGFKTADAYLFSVTEKQEKELEDILEATQEAGVDVAYTERIPVPVNFRTAIKVGGQAKFNPTDYVYGIAKAFEAAGGAILQNCRVIATENGEEEVAVETSLGRFTAKDLVFATHIPPGINLVHLRCVPWRSYAMAVMMEEGTYPEDLSYDMNDPYFYYRSQVVDGQKYLIAGGRDHKTGKEDNTEKHFMELEAHVRKHFNVKSVSYQWSSQYYDSADGLPYIGYLPGQADHIYVATGYGGNGMVYSSVAALLIRKLILKEESPYAKLFDPNRIKPVAGFTSFMSHNAGVVKSLAEKLLPAEAMSALAELAPGEGKVVKFNDQKVAISKSVSGEVIALSPSCTHMQCDVKWNVAEASWDCPCHGARYNAEGTVINGPADKDLEKLPITTMAEK